MDRQPEASAKCVNDAVLAAALSCASMSKCVNDANTIFDDSAHNNVINNQVDIDELLNNLTGVERYLALKGFPITIKVEGDTIYTVTIDSSHDWTKRSSKLTMERRKIKESVEIEEVD